MLHLKTEEKSSRWAFSLRRHLIFAVAGISVLLVAGVMVIYWQEQRFTAAVRELSAVVSPASEPRQTAAINALQESHRQQIRILNWGAVLAMLTLVAGPLWFLRGVLGRIRVIATALERWGAGDLRGRLACSAPDELGLLACHCNALAARCEANGLAPPAEWFSGGVPPANEPAAEGSVSPAAAKRRRRVLVSEDGPESRRFLALILRRAGADVELAENGLVATEKVLDTLSGGSAADNPFDLVFMDIQLPLLNGCDATRRLRQAGYTGRIIALTGKAGEADRQRCLDAGCDDYYTKPIDREVILGLLDTPHKSAC